jgi:hypothetical protein
VKKALNKCLYALETASPKPSNKGLLPAGVCKGVRLLMHAVTIAPMVAKAPAELLVRSAGAFAIPKLAHIT